METIFVEVAAAGGGLKCGTTKNKNFIPCNSKFCVQHSFQILLFLDIEKMKFGVEADAKNFRSKFPALPAPQQNQLWKNPNEMVFLASFLAPPASRSGGEPASASLINFKCRQTRTVMPQRGGRLKVTQKVEDNKYRLLGFSFRPPPAAVAWRRGLKIAAGCLQFGLAV